MTNTAIRTAAAADLATEEAARTWVLTDDAMFFFPEHAGQLLQRVDALRGTARFAPITSVDGRAVPDMTRTITCFHDDVREVR